MSEAINRDVESNNFFICHEESEFFSLCIDYLVLKNSGFENILEYGSGDGTPVLNALSSSGFKGRITGFEINPSAYRRAFFNIIQSGEQKRYIVNKGCFFNTFKKDNKEKCIIANPPYIPAPEKEKLILPYLWGGGDGSEILKRLFDFGTLGVMVLIPSISNPEAVINYGQKKGYNAVQFLKTTISFGTYTSQIYVQNHLKKLHDEKKSYFKKNHYNLCGALFIKNVKDFSRTKTLIAALKCGHNEISVI